MWQRFTERARRMVFYAQEEAGRLGENYVSTEHLLLGLLRENDSVAARLLDQMGVALPSLRAKIEQEVTQGEGRLGQDMQLTPRSKRVIDLAYDEAKQLNNNYIGTEHLLLGMIREGEGLAGRILMESGVTLEQTRKLLRTLQTEAASKPTQAQSGQEAGAPQGDAADSQLTSFKETLGRLAAEAQSLKLKMQGREAGTASDTAPPAIFGGARGDIGILKNADERAVVEFVPSESDLAMFEDVMRIKDEYAYRELVTNGKILLLEAGTQAKLLKRGTGTTDYVRILSGKLAGEVGYVLRTVLQDLKPDDRPFPPPVAD